MSSRNNSRDEGGNDHRNGDDEPQTASAVVVAAAAAREDEEVSDLQLQLHSLLNEEDDVDSAMDWLLYGKIDAKHFAKVLPHTAQDLRDGKTSPQALIDSLHLRLSATLKVRAKDGSGFVGTHMELVTSRLASMSIPENFCNDEQKRWLPEAHSDFARDIFRHCRGDKWNFFLIDNAGMPLLNWEPTIGRDVHLALKETCEEWERKVDDNLFRGRSGTFLFLCPTYKMSPQEATEMVRDIYQNHCDLDAQFEEDLKKIYAKKTQLDAAVRLIAGSALKSSCWECGTAATALRYCSKCKEAQYCSRECQRVAWKSGHKSKCKILNKKCDAFYESLEAVERAHHENSGTLEGTKLSCFDYELVSETFRLPFPITIFPPDASLNQEWEMVVPEGPSMEFFYKNLRRVLRGEWWFYSNTDSLEDYHAKVCGTGSSDVLPSSVDWDSFKGLAQCLTFDLSGFFALFASIGVADEDETMALLFGDNFLVQAATDEEADNGVPMPAERFIEIYQSSDTWSVGDVQLMGDAKAKSRLKSNAKASTMQFFRKNCHK